uniref:Structural maintenance of chromosomes protein n=1 Tax=Panagrolaimus sp. JU765 TaxID=591449 RepID=A0AC34Q685_9BILA
MGYLHSLEIENFKSYQGKHLIGPFRRFSSIVGPNGSGKSNLMDAICFVLGEKTQNLRVRKLGDLIYGAPVGKPIANKCFVKMKFINDDNSATIFARMVTTGGSEYRINDSVVTPAQYHERLEEINIFIKAKNFLVYQGTVESYAMKTPKERTQLFEELSRSGELANEYNKLKQEMIKAEEDAQFNMNKRRGIVQEKREAKIEKDEAERYQNLRDDLANKNIQLYLVQLFSAEQSRQKAKEELQLVKNDLEDDRKVRNERDAVVGKMQKEHKLHVKELKKLEAKVEDMEKKIDDFKPQCSQNKQEFTHLEQKLATAKKSHKAVIDAAVKQEESLKALEERRKEILNQKQSCEANINAQSQQMELNLDAAQVSEYNRLKSIAESQSIKLTTDLESLGQEKEFALNSIQHEKHRIKTLEDKLAQKTAELERQKQALANALEFQKNHSEILTTETVALKKLEVEVKESKQELERLTLELQDLNDQISDAHGDSMESERTRRRNEAVENLKKMFPEKVFGRLVELCSPSQKKYQLAVTKVLGGNMMAVIVDSDDTAEECIGYLKEQRYPAERFLPLSTLEVGPIIERIREMAESVKGKLLYDVIHCPQSNIKKAVQFACNNAVVCDTTDQAKELASGRDNIRCKAVAIDGTLFHLSGVISGGASELKQRAKKWDEQGMKKLKDRRKELQEQCSALHRNRKRELDVEMKRNQISQLENRIRGNQAEQQRLQSVIIPRLEAEVQSLKGELELILPKIEQKTEELSDIEQRIANKEREKEQVTDKVFASFCQQIGVKHIRQYENRELRFHQEKQRELQAFDVELDKLKYEIEFLKSENRRDKEKAEAEKIKSLEKNLKSLKEKIEKQAVMLKQYEHELKVLQKDADAKRSEVSNAEEAVLLAKKNLQESEKKLQKNERTAKLHEQNEQKRAHKRFSLLYECKFSGIELPLIQGNLEDLRAEDESEETENGESQATQGSKVSLIQAETIVVDYSQLKFPEKKLKDENEVNKIVEKLKKEVTDATANLAKIAAPNLRASERMEQVREKEAETTEECENARKKARKARTAFEKVKNQRYKLFTEFFDPVASVIDIIYKQLSRNPAAQAFIGAENQEEPYLDGISYNCVAPGKRFRPMDNLSGGEKTIAALALLFAIHSRNPSPFFVLDEIDAALDNTNISKVVHYISERAQEDMQLIVISLKEEFYNKAEALVGIYPKPASITTSGVLIFDLANFKANLHESNAD